MAPLLLFRATHYGCDTNTVLRLHAYKPVHRQSFHFDTRGHRTGVHTDETSNRSRAPGPPYNSQFTRRARVCFARSSQQRSTFVEAGRSVCVLRLSALPVYSRPYISSRLNAHCAVRFDPSPSTCSNDRLSGPAALLRVDAAATAAAATGEFHATHGSRPLHDATAAAAAAHTGGRARTCRRARTGGHGPKNW